MFSSGSGPPPIETARCASNAAPSRYYDALHYMPTSELASAIAALAKHAMADANSPSLSTSLLDAALPATLAPTTVPLVASSPSRAARSMPRPQFVQAITPATKQHAPAPSPLVAPASCVVQPGGSAHSSSTTQTMAAPSSSKIPPPKTETEAVALLQLLAAEQKANFSLGGSSRFRGVLWAERGRAWRAKIKSGDRTWYLGLHKNELVAAQAYDAGAYFVFGPKAMLNFPEFDYRLFDPPRRPPQWLIQRVVDKLVCGSILSEPARRFMDNNPMLIQQLRTAGACFKRAREAVPSAPHARPEQAEADEC